MTLKDKQRRYHHGDLYEALVKAGTELLMEQGLDGFTLRECARRAGVSHAAPKNHFAAVDDLLCEIAARGFETFVTDLDAASAAATPQDPDRRLMAMATAYVGFARRHPQLYGLMFRPTRPVVKSEHLQRAMMAAWVQLEEAVSAVIGPDRSDASTRAAQVWSLVHGLSSLIIDAKLPAMIDPAIVIADSVASLPDAIRGLGGAPQICHKADPKGPTA